MKLTYIPVKIILLSALFSFACSGRLVKREELKVLNQKYSKEYLLKEKADIGNNRSMKAGTRVKIFFRSDSDSVKVYAYRFNEPREQALGKNILYLFENDFPDEEYTLKYLEEKIDKLIIEAK